MGFICKINSWLRFLFATHYLTILVIEMHRTTYEHKLSCSDHLSHETLQLWKQTVPYLKALICCYILPDGTPRCWGYLVLVQSPLTIRPSHLFEAIFKMFGASVFEVIVVRGCLMWKFKVMTSKILVIITESLAANLKKVRQTSVWQVVPKFWFIWLCNRYFIFYCTLI